ncbi:DUF2630 family protein [Ramlibacter alkalitolerans]|jgi:hypothetical protein|uniref:DUF2630 family protein n=1 Tax=Ramlibacter alkalitolerans TaxID=2039631 RepID=A0ABS1JSF3_9BURK|nr:DUF2630 family protein [Ramlibacter alkalitolerans]MBL0426781.1 DUF2630 family protein [Ramlibacter alkalitolerans]
MSDQTILAHISSLIDEEHALRSGGAAQESAQRLKQLEVELDQCWDLLRQRRAKREYGEDPEAATPRDPGTVEGYIG